MFSNLSRSYVIAEIGVNHEGNFDTAVKQINWAHSTGASAVKFQAYKAVRLKHGITTPNSSAACL